MKIGGSKGPKQTSKTQKSSESKGGDENVDFSQYVQGGASETASTSAATSIAQLDVLLAVQQAEDPTKKAARKRAYVRSENILDHLEGLRMKMLGGNLTIGNMIDVADVVASHRDKIDDPALSAIMDEIDLRAQVEIAKATMAMDMNTRPNI